MRKSVALVLFLFVVGAFAADKIKNVYKISHISPAVVGISCPGNLGDPTVITKSSGVLLISCGSYDPNLLK